MHMETSCFYKLPSLRAAMSYWTLDHHVTVIYFRYRTWYYTRPMLTNNYNMLFNYTLHRVFLSICTAIVPRNIFTGILPVFYRYFSKRWGHLLGHAAMWHIVEDDDDPRQFWPPWAGLGLSHDRCLVMWPNPQVTEHAPYADQNPQRPSTKIHLMLTTFRLLYVLRD